MFNKQVKLWLTYVVLYISIPRHDQNSTYEHELSSLKYGQQDGNVDEAWSRLIFITINIPDESTSWWSKTGIITLSSHCHPNLPKNRSGNNWSQSPFLLCFPTFCCNFQEGSYILTKLWVVFNLVHQMSYEPWEMFVQLKIK